jgi:hypothetical protein
MEKKFNKTYAFYIDMQNHTFKPQSVSKVCSGLKHKITKKIQIPKKLWFRLQYAKTMFIGSKMT